MNPWLWFICGMGVAAVVYLIAVFTAPANTEKDEDGDEWGFYL